MNGALNPSFSLFDSVADRTAQRAAEGTQVVSRALDSVAQGIVAGASRVTQIIASSGGRAGLMLLDAAATAIQQRSLAALSRIGTFVSLHVGRLGTWVTGELRGAFGFIAGGLKAVGNLFSALWGGLKTAFSAVWGATTQVGGTLLRLLTPLWEAVAGAATFAATHLLSGGAWLAQRLAGALGLVWGVVSGIIGHVVSALGGAINLVSGWVESALAGVRRRIIDWVAEIGVAVGKLIGGLIQFVDSLLASIPIAGPIIQIALAVGGVMAGAFLLAKTSALLGSGISLAAHALGSLGTTLASGVTTLGKSVWAGLSGAGKAASNWFGGAASGAGRIAAGLGAGASNAWNSALGAGSKVLAGGSGSLGGLLTGVTRLFSTLVPQLLAFGQAVLTLVGVGIAVGIFAKALIEATKSAMEFAKNAQLLSAQSGLTLQSAARVLQNLKGVGVDGAPEGDADIFRLKARMWGLPGFDQGDFVERLASRFQSMGNDGLMGRMMRSGMMKSLGLTSPDWMRAAMTDPAKLRAQQAYTSNINSVLGLTPAALKAYAEDVPLFLNRLGTVWDGVKMKLASTALPIAESLLGNLTGWLAQNANKISGWIEYAVRWIFVKAPLIAMNAVVVITSTLQRAIGGVFAFGQVLVAKLPQWLGGAVTFIGNMIRSGGAMVKAGAIWMAQMIETGADWMARAISSLIVSASKGLASFGHMLADWVRSLSKGLLGLQGKDNPLRQVVESFANVYDSIINNSRSFQASMVGMFSLFPYMIGEAIKQALGPAMLYQPIADAVNKVFNGNTPIDNYNDTLARLGGQSKLSKHVGDLFDKGVPNTAKAGMGIADRMDRYWDRFEQGSEARARRIANAAVSPLDWAARGLRGAGDWAGRQGQRMGDWVDPARGHGPNIGTQLGQMGSQLAAPVVDFIGNTIKPGIDSISDFARSYRASLGSEPERNRVFDELLRVNKQQLDLMREQYRTTGSFGSSADRVAAMMMDEYSQRSAAALRSI